MNNKLQEAIDALLIKDVYLRSSKSFCVDSFDPKYLDDKEDKLLTGYKHQVLRSELGYINQTSAVVENSENDPAVEDLLFRVFIDMGARWFAKDNDKKPLAEIEAIFVAEYELSIRPSDEALNEFALKNASYHVWPYWREYLMNHATRMQLPRVVLPVMQLASNNHKKNI